MTFRICTIDDYNLLINLWDQAGLPCKPLGRDSRESIAREMRGGNGLFIVAEIDTKPAGAILATHDGRKGWINRLAVLPDYRNKGIGRALVGYAEELLEQRGIGIFACMIEDYNSSSLEVFQKLGYIEFEGMHYLTKRNHPDI
ncbi:MAG: GNAT family N-acetyltransferase [Bacteroidota bacterium]|nr:GNAT family N-acetyltransferase [Bacteroidota bacterium]